jgi:hypothetical protein
MKGTIGNIIPKLKKVYKELFNNQYPEKFDGLDIIKTLQHTANKYNIKFTIYNHDDNERLQHLNTISPEDASSAGFSDRVDSDNTPNNNLLMINGIEEGADNNSNNIITHVMYIKDIQKYTKLHICPKCGYMPPANQHGCYHKDRFEEHMQNYESKIKRSLCLNEQSVSFIPHIQKNPIFAYLLACNRKDEYKVIQEYITFDFETVVKKRNS